MEVQSSFLVITFLLSLLMLWLAKNFKAKNLHKLPPGPWKLPLIGNLHQLAAASSLPHRALHELAQRYGPLMHLQLGEISAVIISSPNMAKEIMKTHDLAFAQRPAFLSSDILGYGSQDIAFAPYGDYWRQMRKICTLELLSAKRVQSFSHIREDEVAILIETIQSSAGAPVNLTSMINSFISNFVSRAAFGNISEDHEEFLLMVKEAIELADGFDLADLFPSLKPMHLITGMKAKLENIHKKLDNILEKIVKENQVKQMRANKGTREEKNENLVEVLLRVLQSGSLETPITINNVKAVIWDIFAAGTDTSTTVLGWTMSEMMRNTRVRERAQAEIRQTLRGKETIHETDIGELSYLKAVIRETLRLHPPLPLLLPRESREACRIGGYELPTKTKVMVNAWALGRDPEYWYDPESFKPERFNDNCIDFKGTNFEYIPFGAGRRICPGISFGLANVEFALAKLLYHFNWELPQGMKPEDLDMDEGFGAVVGRKNNLCLIPTPYNPSILDNAK
ncbi:cytochrome P450 71D8-like [Gastrolobium bilobum]|uniref:cytochrome P450 71D8-like n=1 Tax=Gastrolobium bilobum TaxID=150636 RepID=UPI002AB06622|nr:cytochrome P450 71D8-like [Gastrolobium bilobum]